MDSKSQVIQPGIESFFSSNRGEAYKSRMLLWGFALIGFTISMLRAPHTGTNVVAMVISFLVLIGLVDYFLLRQFRPGQLVIQISDEGIESPMLSGPRKKLSWKDIKNVSIQVIHDQPYLVFALSPDLGLPDKKHFLTGINPSRPHISLAGLDAQAQDLLAEALSRHLCNRSDQSVVDITNPVREVRKFLESVRELAPMPWVTSFLVVANAIVWIAMVASGAKILGAPISMLYEWGANATSAVQSGQSWRLLTSMFLHGDVFHLVINMAALVSAGLIVERIYGHLLYTLIYFASGIVGSSLSLHFASQTTVAVGASGAIFGVTGALFVAIFQHRKRLPNYFSKQMITSLSFFITYSIIQSLTKTGIDTAAHVGGLLAGSALAHLLPERLNIVAFRQQRLQRGVIGLALAILTSVSLVHFAPEASVDIEKSIHGSATVAAGMKQFAELMESLVQEEKDVAAGKISIKESDERSRSVFAPRMAEVLKTLRNGYLPPTDPRLPLLKATIRMGELMEESLAMQSVYQPGSNIPLPADPARAAEIKREMVEVMSAIKKANSQ
ncbi:rhomboid family protein [Sulfuricystis multivorans]|uniref:rhomboid family protein n=1 Tax=Sulfuricystis multivorans TaxID=2211108 RepID=UPI000F841236|nr:rhomboid family intramembrane serine protease [Sulfuricystis multivorans]